jgi:hemerythrin superfamily protein
MTNRTEALAAKVVGKAKAAKATLEGLTGVFRHLEEEHGKVSALLMRLKASSDPSVRRELLPTIRYELLAHEQAELKEVYPVLRENAQTRGVAEAHATHADRLESAMAALTDTAVDSHQWPMVLEQLVEEVKHHVREEEEDFFPLAQQVVGERAGEMRERYELAKAAALKQLKATP